MSNSYKHLSTQERAVVMTMRDDQCILSTSHCYKHQLSLLINSVLRLLFET